MMRRDVVVRVGSYLLHLRDLVDQTSGDLDGDQRHRLAEVLLEYADIFPIPGEAAYWPYRRGGTRYTYGRPATHPVRPTSDVPGEDEEKKRLASQRC